MMEKRDGFNVSSVDADPELDKVENTAAVLILTLPQGAVFTDHDGVKWRVETSTTVRVTGAQ